MVLIIDNWCIRPNMSMTLQKRLADIENDLFFTKIIKDKKLAVEKTKIKRKIKGRLGGVKTIREISENQSNRGKIILRNERRSGG